MLYKEKYVFFNPFYYLLLLQGTPLLFSFARIGRIFREMKKGKKKTTKASPKKDFKIVIFVSAILLLIVGAVTYKVFVEPVIILKEMSDAGNKALEDNPAKKLASIMIPFAKENNLKKIEEYNGAAGGMPLANDNTIPSYIFLFESNQNMENTYYILESYLRTKGYNMEKVLYTYDEACSFDYCESHKFAGGTKNDNEPYYVFRGVNMQNDKLYGEISNKTYDIDAGDMFGTHKIDSGKTVLNITFTSHER